jgi:hypothetical protein
MEEIIPLERRYPNGTRVAILNDRYVGRVVGGPCTVVRTRDTLYTKNLYDLVCDEFPQNEYSELHKNIIPWNDTYVVGAFVPGHQPRLVREGLYRPGDEVTLDFAFIDKKKVRIIGGPYVGENRRMVYEVDKRTPGDVDRVYERYKVYWQDFLLHNRELEDGPIRKRRAKYAANVAHAARAPAMKEMWKNKIGSIDFRNVPIPPKSWYRKAVNAVSSRIDRGVEALSEKLFPFNVENDYNYAENHAEAAGAAAATPAAAAAPAAPSFPPVRHLPNSVASKIANFLVEPQAAARAKVRNITRNIPRGERSGIQLKGGRRRTLRCRR